VAFVIDVFARGIVCLRVSSRSLAAMNRSLRLLVEKWLVLIPAMPSRVTGFGCVRLSQRRCVCIESSRSAGVLAIYFFLQVDGVCRAFLACGQTSLIKLHD
jgi:hypothetical protein